jgi:hypothetical protein
MTPAGFPHSDIFGSASARDSPKLFAACHVLHRLLAPRHPPRALSSLTPSAADQAVSRGGVGMILDKLGEIEDLDLLPKHVFQLVRCGPEGPPAPADRRRSQRFAGE